MLKIKIKVVVPVEIRGDKGTQYLIVDRASIDNYWVP